MGGADAFLAFLRDELVPQIERDYPAAPQRMLAGHSRGALFVVYAMVTDPAVFDVYTTQLSTCSAIHAHLARLRLR